MNTLERWITVQIKVFISIIPGFTVRSFIRKHKRVVGRKLVYRRTYLNEIILNISTLFRYGRKKGVIIPMLLTAVGAAGSVLLTTDDESNKGE